MLSAGSRTGGRLSGNIRSRAGGGRRFLGRPSLPTLPCTRLGRRRSAAGLSGNARFRSGGGGRFLGRFSLSAFSCTLLSRSAGLFHRAGLLRGGLRLCRFGAGLCFGRLRFFSPLVLL